MNWQQKYFVSLSSVGVNFGDNFITLKIINGYAVDVYAWGYMAL